MVRPARTTLSICARAADSRFDAAHGEVALTRLVGREEEVELLLRRWAQAGAGEGQVVLLSGEPGIGKSRISQTLRDGICTELHHGLRYQCSPYHTNSAFHPIIEQLQRAAHISPADSLEEKLFKLEGLVGAAQADHLKAVPLIAGLLGIPTGAKYPPLQYTPQKQKDETIRVLGRQLEALSRAGAGVTDTGGRPLAGPFQPGSLRSADPAGADAAHSGGDHLPSRVRAQVERAEPCDAVDPESSGQAADGRAGEASRRPQAAAR